MSARWTALLARSFSPFSPQQRFSWKMGHTSLFFMGPDSYIRSLGGVRALFSPIRSPSRIAHFENKSRSPTRTSRPQVQVLSPAAVEGEDGVDSPMARGVDDSLPASWTTDKLQQRASRAAIFSALPVISSATHVRAASAERHPFGSTEATVRPMHPEILHRRSIEQAALERAAREKKAREQAARHTDEIACPAGSTSPVARRLHWSNQGTALADHKAALPSSLRHGSPRSEDDGTRQRRSLPSRSVSWHSELEAVCIIPERQLDAPLLPASRRPLGRGGARTLARTRVDNWLIDA